MLTKISDEIKSGAKGSFAIVAARYNPKYTDALVKSAEVELAKAGAGSLQVFRVPGSFEVPVVAAELARSKRFDVVICFGAILRGATTHAQQIADAVSDALMKIQVETGVPVIHGVLLFENEEQASARCFGVEHNRGIEAARAALEMAGVMRQVRGAAQASVAPKATESDG